MGNSNTKESRPGDSAARGHRSGHAPDNRSGPSNQADRANARNRISRGDLNLMLGLTGAHNTTAQQTPEQRRETKQEREARRLEKERVARIKERERSIREEHVDGGYLVTMGTYTGPEDFNKQIVRQLQIDRKIAPFWRGLNDKDDNWTEFQIIAAARGLPIPPPDQTPPDELIPRPMSSPSPVASSQNLTNLTVPIGGRTQSSASDHSVSNSGSALPSPVSASSGRAASPFRSRGKSLAAVLGGSSRNGSTTDIAPREITLPNDPFVNGQPLEVFLYKDATECPICFLTYPPYLNHTRCCDQSICSECFVQIKRPDPHYPEGHNESDPPTNPEEAVGLLVSEPACCPYCTQPDFGVTYEPPPFRRGLAHAISSSAVGTMNTAMSSSSSLHSGNLSPTLGVTQGNRRRTQSLSANAPNVILTDRIRPDWSTKLQAARAHQARRAAAATALHTAAFLMGNATDSRPFRVSRFGRRHTGSGSASPGGAGVTADNAASAENGGSGTGTPPAGPDVGPRGSSRTVITAGSSNNTRRSRMEDLEDMMFMEAIRLSLAAEEERKRKQEKEERKEAKRREKEERKAAKAAAKHGPYESGEGRSGHSSASGSTLSLSGLGFGRKRGNSGASTLRVEASVANAIASTSGPTSPADPSAKDKGKAVERSLPSTPEVSQDGSEDSTEDSMAASTSTTSASTSTARPIPSPHQPAGPSHLRQMSSASSVSSSLPDSQAGSYTNPSQLQDPTASGTSLNSRAGGSGDGDDQDRDPSASTEPMFNFRSLAEVVGVSLEGENAGRRLSRIEADKVAKKSAGTPPAGESETKQDEANDAAEVERIEDVERPAERLPDPTISVSPPDSKSYLTPPELTVTPETPAPVEGSDDESKQLGYAPSIVERPNQVTQ
ncbi:hypothetical protein GE09DRAFT_283013 [Coniochaeta sp. 2T2.1]|nr:hypothetical protein GE09DRAFT_283013 [Coniochaeta sp. 2T2.1]